MKNLKNKDGDIQLQELAEKIKERFGLTYTVTNNNRNEIIVAKSKSIGCKLVLTKKRLFIHGTFPTPGSLILAMLVLILGLVIIPMIIYMLFYKKEFEAIEKEVYSYVKAAFADRLI